MQENGKIVVGTKIDTKGIDEGLKDIDKKVTAHDVSQSFNKGLSKVKGTIKNLASSITGIFSKGLSVVGGVIKGIIGAIGGILTVVKVTIASIGKAMLKATLASMGLSATLGVIGLAGMVLVKAFKKVAEANKELISNIKYLVYVIGEALSPVTSAVADMISSKIKNIINLLTKVITYVAYIINAWFGINILANVSKDAFMKMQESTEESSKNLGKASKNAKELKKQLAGFDEMNILQDNSSTGGASGGGIGDVGGVGDMAMPTLELDGEVPEWIKWIAENKDLVISALLGIAGALAALKLEEFLKKLGIIDKISWKEILGVGVAVAGLVYAIQGLLDYLNNPTWENFGKIIQGIGVFVIGLGIIFLGLPGIIAGAVILIVGTIIKYWDEIKAFLVNGIKWLEDSMGAIRDFFGDQVANIYQTFITMFKGIIIGFDTTFKGLKQILDGIIQFVKGVFAGNWKQAWEGIKNIFWGVVKTIEGIFFTVLSVLAGTAKAIVQTIGYTIGDIFRGIINAVLLLIETQLNRPINAINRLLDVINAVPGIKVGKLGTIKLPRLAKGTILNNPGQGVPVAGGRAIAGEAGREAYLPLSDSQLLEELGSTIGKYITVNLTNVTDIDGRTIARKVTEINNNNNFLLNR